jgi:hypothetical protein
MLDDAGKLSVRIRSDDSEKLSLSSGKTDEENFSV